MTRRLFIICTICLSVFTASFFVFADDPETGNLVSWWEMDEGSGNTVGDSQGSNDGSRSGASWTTSGLLDDALDFDGTNDNVNVPDDATLDITTTLSVEAWFNVDAGLWRFKKPITLTNAGSAQTNYQVLVSVDYVSGHMNNDFSDLRFYNSSGTALDYWIESYTNSNNAKVWVEVDNIASGTSTIYMYYGNSAASSASSGANTWVFFDDFSSWSGWSDYGTGSVQQDTTTFSSNTLNKINNDDPNGGYKTIGTTVSTYRMLVRDYRSDTAQSGGNWDRYGLEDSNWDGYSIRREAEQSGSSNFGVERRDNASGTDVAVSSLAQPWGNWYVTELTRDSSSNFTATLYDENHSSIGSASGSDSNHSPFDRFVVRGGNPYFLDWVAVGKYASSDPTVSVGDETPTGVSKAGAYGIGADTAEAHTSINGTTISAAAVSGWNQVVLTYDSSGGANNLKLYVNGSLADQTTVSGAINTNNLPLIFGDDIGFDGIIDDVKIYNDVLTPAEVSGNYDRAIPQVSTIDPTSGTVGATIDDAAIAGTNFQSGLTVKLTKAGETDITATDVSVTDDDNLTCDFGLTGAATGYWNVVVTNPNGFSGTLGNGFSIEKSGLVSWWKMDENSGNTVSDSIGPNDGTRASSPNDPAWTTTAAAGNALVFDGNDYVNVPDDTTLQITGQLSLEGWVYETTRGNYAKVVSRRSGNDFYFLGSDNGRPYGGIGDGSSYTVSNKSFTMPTDEWHHLVMTFSDSDNEMKIYYDGVLQETINVTHNLAGNSGINVSIGADNQGTQNFWQGTLDEVRIYNFALDASEVADRYKETEPTLTSITPATGGVGETVSVTIEGSNFQTGATVALTKSGESDINGSSVTVVSTTEITCDVDLTGAVTGDWNVIVTNLTGQDDTLTDGFEVIGISVVSVDPSGAMQGTSVDDATITGTNFQSGCTVKLTKSGQSDITATDVTFISDTEITCDFDLTGAATGYWNVVVTNPDTENGQLTDGFIVFDPGFIAWLKMDDGSGSTATDSINSHDGSISGVAWTNYAAIGKALEFSGSDYANIADHNDINTGGPYTDRTILVWFKTSSDVTTRQMIYEEGGSTRGFNIYLYNGRVYVGGYNRAEYNWSGTWHSAAVSTDTWYHVALRLDNAGASVQANKFLAYVDSISIGSGNGGQVYAHGNNISIGMNGDNTYCHDGVDSSAGEYFTGTIDELKIYNSSLSPQDIIDDYNLAAPAVTSISPDTGLSGETVDDAVIQGGNFQTAVTVALQKAGETDIDATDVTIVSLNQLTCDFDLTGAASGVWDVVVTNPTGQSDTIVGGFSINPCTLSWTGGAGYVSDGLDPETGYSTTNFIFQIEYTNTNDTAPVTMKLYLDKNGDGDYGDAGEDINMGLATSGDPTKRDGDYTNGEWYVTTQTIPYGPNTDNCSYYFEADDGTYSAVGMGSPAVPTDPADAINAPDVLPTLSLSLDTNTWDIGLVDTGSVTTMAGAQKVTVTNDGEITETFTLSLADPADWTAGSSAANEVYVLNGAYCHATDDTPVGGDFNEGGSEDVITTSTQTATGTKFTYSTATATGDNVPPTKERALFFQFEAPTATTATNQQTIIVTVGCQAS